MKTISVSLEESEIDELLRSTDSHSNSELLRNIIKQWRQLRSRASDQDKEIESLRSELSEIRLARHRERDSEIEQLRMQLGRARRSLYLDRALTILLFVMAAIGIPTLIWMAIVRYGL